MVPRKSPGLLLVAALRPLFAACLAVIITALAGGIARADYVLPDTPANRARGLDDQLGRLNLLTEERVLEAIKEVRRGKAFCLSLPLTLPGGNAINPSRLPPELKPVIREGEIAFDGPVSDVSAYGTN